mmetsp:Transcript_17816/g.26689  ORF Transcript_17816/g.26689 Transcript_17816/m.26689 type:complete len:154 (-) Transcript_17816:304-765(-)
MYIQVKAKANMQVNISSGEKNNDDSNDGVCSDCNNDDDGSTCSIDAENENEDSICLIPKPGMPFYPSANTTNNDNLRQVSGTCAICLSSYKIGETVIWSSNPDCPHAFHKNCIFTWIKKRYTSSCPCCRRAFIDSDLYSRVKYRYIHKHRVKS